MEAIFPYVGGKNRMTKKLIPLIPDHTCYVEPFGGAASLLLAKPKSTTEVYNDIDNALYNFFSLLQDADAFEEFHDKLKITPHSRSIYKEFRETWREQTDIVERVYQWYVTACMSFGGCMGRGWKYSQTRDEAGHFRNRIERLPKFVKRLLEVSIENKSWNSLLDCYDRPGTFFYLDPPYVPSTRKGKMYAYEMDKSSHERLIERMEHLDGKAMLSGYANPIYEALPWKRLDFPVKCHVIGKTNRDNIQNQRIESVWMNY